MLLNPSKWFTLAELLAKVLQGDVKFVNAPRDFENIDSTKQYFITKQIDMTGYSIEVPAGGLSISGYNNRISGLYTTDENRTMFTSPVGGSGDLFIDRVRLSTSSATGSKIYDLVGATGFEALETTYVNYEYCTSRGEINNYRQGLEEGIALFYDQPTLTLSGTWLGGYVIKTSITRFLDSDMTEPLYKAGSGFVMNSRFAVQMNLDLPINASLADFTPANFTAPSLVEVKDSIFTRDGNFISGDGGYFPNLDPDDLACKWTDNNGLRSTIEGGYNEITTPALTSIPATNTYYDIAGTFTASKLDHFSSPVNGVLQNDANNPIEFNLTAHFSLEGNPNDVLMVKGLRYNSTTAQWEDEFTQETTIDSSAGVRDVARIDISRTVILERGDQFKLQVANSTGTTGVTAETGSYYQLVRI